MSCARGLASARADARSRIGTSRQRQPLHKFLVVLFVSAAPIIHSEGPNADCFGGTVSSYTPSVCAELNQPTCCESATLDEISSSLRRFRNALRFPALTGSAVGTDGAPLAKEELCSSVFRELLCGRCRSTADNGARNVNFNLRNAQKSRPNLIVCTDTISDAMKICSGAWVNGTAMTLDLVYNDFFLLTQGFWDSTYSAIAYVPCTAATCRLESCYYFNAPRRNETPPVAPTGVTEDASAGDDNAGPPVLVIALAAGGGGLLLVALLVGVYCFRKRQSRVSEAPVIGIKVMPAAAPMAAHPAVEPAIQPPPKVRPRAPVLSIDGDEESLSVVGGGVHGLDEPLADARLLLGIEAHEMSPEDGPTAVGSIEESELAWFEAQPTESILDLRVPTMVHSLYGTAAMHSSSTFLYMEGDELPGEPVLNEEGKEHEVFQFGVRTHTPNAQAVAAEQQRQPHSRLPAGPVLLTASPAKTQASLTVFANNLLVDSSQVVFKHRLGSGAFGEVMLAEFQKAQVAIKMFHGLGDIVDSSSQLLNSFIDEAKVLRSLSHPHIVQFLGVLYEPTKLGLIMEFVSGGNLFTRIHRPTRPFRWVDVQKMLVTAAAGLEYLHNQRIIHRDVKSANMLLTDDGCVKISDFGLSRIRSASTVMKSVHIAGSPAWMAPEAMKDNNVDFKCDVYAFAIVIWELVYLAVPWESLALVQVYHQVVVKEQRPSTSKAPAYSIPSELIGLMEEAWVPVPSHRPTMHEIRYRLKQMQLGSENPSPSHSERYPYGIGEGSVESL